MPPPSYTTSRTGTGEARAVGFDITPTLEEPQAIKNEQKRQGEKREGEKTGSTEDVPVKHKVGIGWVVGLSVVFLLLVGIFVFLYWGHSRTKELKAIQESQLKSVQGIFDLQHKVVQDVFLKVGAKPDLSVLGGATPELNAAIQESHKMQNAVLNNLPKSKVGAKLDLSIVGGATPDFTAAFQESQKLQNAVLHNLPKSKGPDAQNIIANFQQPVPQGPAAQNTMANFQQHMTEEQLNIMDTAFQAQPTAQQIMDAASQA